MGKRSRKVQNEPFYTWIFFVFVILNLPLIESIEGLYIILYCCYYCYYFLLTSYYKLWSSSLIHRDSCAEKRGPVQSNQKNYLFPGIDLRVFISFNVTLLGGISLSLITACARCLDGFTGCPAPALQGPF